MKCPLHLLALFLSIGGILFAAPEPSQNRTLEENFQNPPHSAKPQTWWHWMNGNVTREGITADLEAMKRVGIGGAQMFDVVSSIPSGPIVYGTEEWRALVQYTLKEASRLGLEMGMHNCAGWSSSGGPWVTPEYGMQEVVMSETRASGPTHFSARLPQPLTRLDFYRDIAVLAIRDTAGKAQRMADFSPVVTSSVKDLDGRALLDEDEKTSVNLPLPTPEAPQFIQFAFEKPYAARRLIIDPGPAHRGFEAEFQASDDGVHFRKVVAFSLPYGATTRTFGFPEVSARYYRLFITRPARTYYPDLILAGITLDRDFRLENYEQKAAYKRADTPIVDPQSSYVPGDAVIPLDGVIDLTDKFKPDGSLEWDVPAGQWTVLRIGHTTTGEKNHPAGRGGVGLECDKLSRKAVEFFWNGMMAKIIADAGKLAGTTFTNILVDSYEMQSTNWTPGFREEFARRCGYDLLKYLPTLTGRAVGSGEISERFLWDLRRTLADLFAENYSGTLAELAGRHGLVLALEPGGGPTEELLYAKPAAIPMTEFWAGGDPVDLATGTHLAASAAHLYGRDLVGAEAFTSRPEKSNWKNDPRSLKALGDGAYCSGISRFYFHTFAHQPWLNRAPGMTMGMWGSHFDRTNTWWDKGSAWMTYLSRCQYLLQQGRFVADVLYFSGEGAPSKGRAGNPPLPDGYRYDHCNTDALLTRITVQEGLLELPNGAGYRLLVLPPERQMTPRLLRRMRDLVQAGATVVGPKPSISPSLQGYPQCDEEVAALADEVWGNCDGQTVKEHAFGKGRVIWGKDLGDVLASMNVPPDFETGEKSGKIRFLHRSHDDAEIYFVANLREAFRSVNAVFRVQGKTPEIWNPRTGAQAPAAVYREAAGRMRVPLALEPAESLFVIFRNHTADKDLLVSVERIETASSPALQIRKAVYEAMDNPQRSMDVTALVTEKIEQGSLRLKVGNDAFGKDPAGGLVKQLRIEYALNGKPFEKILREGRTLEIPDLSEAEAEPVFTVAVDSQGHARLQTREPGNYQIETAAGKKTSLEIPSVPAPVEVSGPWQIDFPPGLGAPESVTLDQLASWTDHSKPGVRYFSGTAVYIKELNIPAEAFTDGGRLQLDLGEVKNIAQVRLNGKDLGILWKPPFRIDLAKFAHPGKNQLEIAVTNLWPNRLIGDEQLPPDCTWLPQRFRNEGESLKEWPQWFLEGKPSPTGRIAFATWRHWHKDDALLPSGLLGPVRLVPEVTRLID